MDYHSLKRRELQALCKEHNIPANSANSVLADKLSALLNEKQKPITRHRTCMKSSVETTEEGEPAASKRQAKKVRFSPSNDLVELELRPSEKQRDVVTQIKSRRKSVAKNVEKPVVDNNATVDDSAQIPVKLTRSRRQLSGTDVVIPNNEKKPSRRGAKDVEKGTDVDKETEGNVRQVTRSKAHTLKIVGGGKSEEIRQSKRPIKYVERESESVEGTVVSRARVTRSKAQTMMEGGTGRDVNPYVKKKTGKQVETDGQNVEPFKEIVDVPVRATRSRRQTLKEDIGNTVTNPQADKKRTRREMKATDLSSSSSHVVPVDKQEPPKRKSLRTRGVETLDEDEGDKVEVVNDGRVTRSKAPLEMEISGRNRKNKANKVEIQQLEEPPKHAGKKNVNRRKSVLQPEKTEVVLHLEEPVNRQARKNTRRKSVIQKATKMVESPTVGKKQPEDKENVTRSGKDASEIEFKEATTGSPNSRKRRGTPIIEDQISETEYGSLDDRSPESATCSARKSEGNPVAKKQVESSSKKSPKSSTRSARKSRGKSVAKKQAESSLKKSVSRMNNQSSVENTSKGESRATRSGAISRDSSSKKRAKLSGTKQSDSEDPDVKSSKEGSPNAKMGNFKLDKEVTEPEATPAIDKSDRQFTHSAIRSQRKEPGQSAIKEQPIGDAQLSTPKAAKFRHDPAVNTAPGRITRRGIKHGGNAAGSFSEKVGKKKQTSRSAHKKPFDDAQIASPEVAEVGPDSDVGTKGVLSEIKRALDEAQMSSPEVADVGPNPDSGTVGVGSETSKEVTGQMLGDLSASESVGLPTKVLENRDSVSGTAIDTECASPVSGKNASWEVMEDAGARVERSTYEASPTPCLTENLLSGKQENPSDMQSFDDETPLGKNLSSIRMTSVSMADVAGTVPDAVSGGSHVQNQNEDFHVESGIFSDAVDLETSVLKSGRPDAKEKETESKEPGSPSKGLQTDVMVEEPQVSYDVVSSAVCHASIQQSDVADDGEQYDQDEIASAQKPFMSEPDFEDRGGADGVDAQETDSVAGDYDVEPNRNDTLDQLTGDNKLQGSAIEENDTEVDIVAARDSLAEHRELPTGKNDIYGLAIDRSDVTDDTGKEPAKELEFEAAPSTCNNIHDIPVLCKSDGEDSSGNAAKETDSLPLPAFNMIQDPLLIGSDGEDEGVTSNEDHEANPKTLPDIDAFDASLLGKDGFSMPRQPESISEPSSVPDDDTNVAKELETGLQLSNANKTLEVSVSGNDVDIERVLDDNNGAWDGESEHDERVLDDNNDAWDGESEHDQLTSIDNPAKDEVDVGGDDSEPAQIESMPVVAEVLARSCDQEPEQMLNVAVDNVLRDTVEQSDSVTSKDTPKTLATNGNDDMAVRVDALEDPVLDINKDVVSSILGDTYDMDAEDDRENEQRMIESDEGFQPKESGGVSWITKESLPIFYKLEESAPVDDTYSDLPTIKEDNRNEQEETQNAGTSLDWGDYDFGTDEFEKPVPADGSAVVVGKVKKDDQDSDLQTSARASSSIEESSGLAAGLSNSVRNLENDPRNAVDEKSNRRIDMLKGSAKAADVTQEVLNWSDLSLKSLFATPTASRISCVKDSHEDAVDLANQDTYSSLKSLFATPATTRLSDAKNDSSLKPLFKTPAVPQISHVKDAQEDVVCFANQDPYSSLKPLFTTPSTSQIGHVKDGQEDAVSFANQDPYSSLKPLFTTPATTQTGHVKDDASNFANKDSSLKSLFSTPASSRTSHANDRKADAVNFTFPAGRSHEDVGASRTAAHEFNHQWEDDHSKVIDGETQGNAVRGPDNENEMYGVPSFEDYPSKLFGDEEVGGLTDRSGRNTNFDFKGDQVDQVKQFEFLSEAAGTSPLDPSGFECSSTHGGSLRKRKKL